MGINFKKGHIIPRWCHVKTVDRKAQHCATFGCDVDVVITGGVVQIYALSHDAVINIRGTPQRKMRNGTIKCTVAAIDNVYVDFSRVPKVLLEGAE